MPGVDLIYAAALDAGASWLELGARLMQVMDAPRSGYLTTRAH
jgi:hypothetical protein